jgi:glycogen phosphorylase
MNKQRNKPIYEPLNANIEGFNSLAELALDLRWSWNHYGDKLWSELDPELWKITQNPWIVLQTVSTERLQKLLGKTAFRKEMDKLLEIKKQKSSEPAWFQQTYPDSTLSCIAYFSMEFMLSEGLPIYSGGLGNVAGDQLKEASDMGVPVIGVGLLYQQGYFRQIIDHNGVQQELYPYNDPGQLPITPLRNSNGEWLRLKIKLPGYSVWLRTWQVQVGRVKLYLLDSNDAANYPAHRGITSELYGGGPELRLKQEILLGIGGWRLLEELGIKPEVCHLNEGHAAFAVLERACSFMQKNEQPFEVALTATRAGNIFTTHTAVPVGFDRYEPKLIEQYLGGYAKEKLDIDLYDLLALGRRNSTDTTELFNMTYLALRGCGGANGVSQLHGKVSRQLFAPLFPNWPVDEVPIGHVTNGVHMPTWDSPAADDLWTEACGKDRWHGTVETLEQDIDHVSDTRLWTLRTAASKTLVEYARERLSHQLIASGSSSQVADATKELLDPGVLTLGFARRFATYKRPNLLLHDPERLLRILNNPKRPVQIILAGKAHPADEAGQALIKEWIHFIRQSGARSRVVFLEDYDMHLTGHLVQGVDVWLNTPQRPWEACGTSGMKVLVNGGINLSELDGWWAEAYTPKVGWALGDGQEHSDDPTWDAKEANTLYDLIEHEVAPEFYERNDDGIPVAWVERMRDSMAQLTPRFSANRTLCEYTEQYYLPMAEAFRSRTANKGEFGRKVVNWKHELEQKWDMLRFGEVKVETREEQHVFEIEIHLDGLDPDAVRVELYADGVNGADPVKQEMNIVETKSGSQVTKYQAFVPSASPPADYTARLMPYFDGVAIPLENQRILWQR